MAIEPNPARSGDDLFSGRGFQTSHHELGSATRRDQNCSRGRGQGEDLGGRLRSPSFDTPPPPLRDAQPPERRAHEGGPVLLPTDRPAATAPNPSSAKAPTITSCSGAVPKSCSAASSPTGTTKLTKLGKSFFKDKWVDWVVHVPIIIRSLRRNGWNRGMPYERTKRLPVTDLNVALSRQSEGSRTPKQPGACERPCSRSSGTEPNDIILELSDETYYLDATREWTFSQQAMQVVDDQVVLDTVLDQPLGALRDVSGRDEILESAFELRPSAARGADAAAAARGAFGLRRNLHRERVAGARHHPPKNPIILRLAVAGTVQPAAGGLRARGQRSSGAVDHFYIQEQRQAQRPHTSASTRTWRASPGTGRCPRSRPAGFADAVWP